MIDATSSPTSSLAYHYGKVVRRGWWVVLLCSVVAGLVAFVVSDRQQRTYESTASVLFRPGNIDQQLFGFSSSSRSPDAGRDAATNLDLVLQPVVAQRTAAALGVAPEVVSEAVQAKLSGSSDIANIVVTDPDPRRAAKIATLYAKQFIEYRRRADQGRIADAKRRVDAELSALPRSVATRDGRQLLEERASQLSTLAAVQTGNVELVAGGRPADAPVAPRVARSTALGAVLGLLIAFGLLLLRARFDQRIRDTEDVTAGYGMVLLGEVPDTKEIGDRTSADPLPGAQADVFRLLRARLEYFNVDRHVRSVLLTSGVPGEGKSTLAWHLARAAAEVDQHGSVLLIEADLRRPALSGTRGLQRVPGLSDVLAHDMDLDDVLQTVPLGPTVAGGSTLSFLSAGSQVPSPTQLLSSQKLRDLLRALHERFDFVVIDAAPASFVPDTLPLLSQVDGVIVVARLTYSRRNVARRLREQLDQADATTLGVIANGAKRPTNAYYEYYGDTVGTATVDPPGPDRATERTRA